MEDSFPQGGARPTTVLSLTPIEWSGLILVALATGPAIFLSIVGRPTYALLSIAAVLGFCLMLFPRVTFYLFLISLSLYVPQRLSYFFSIHPYDIMMAIVFLGMVLDFLLRERTGVRSALFDWPFIVLITATLISAVFAYSLRYSLVPLIRIVVIYLAFRAVFKFALELGVRKIIVFYIHLVFALSVVNSTLFFVYSGQTRIFGPAGLGFETLSMTALPMALAFLIWSVTRREQLKYGVISIVIGFGILATQSRAPLLAVVITLPLLLVLATLKSRREKAGRPLRIMRNAFVTFCVLAVLAIALGETWFSGAMERYEDFIRSFTRPRGTVALRITLWTAALRTFLDNPITGVGIGNFRIVHQIYPDVRLAPLWFYVTGMSAHNVILHYLAETGIIGSLALVVLAWKGLRTSFRAFRKEMQAHHSQVSVALFLAMVVFCVTILYMRAWTWGQGGYIMAMLFGLNAAWHRRLSEAETERP